MKPTASLFLGTAGLGILLAAALSFILQTPPPPLNTYTVWFINAQERKPDMVAVHGTSYKMESGCATFTPNDETICGILMIVKDLPQ